MRRGPDPDFYAAFHDRMYYEYLVLLDLLQTSSFLFK
jgi:hypothetical protein